jgi:hypothetical protein
MVKELRRNNAHDRGATTKQRDISLRYCATMRMVRKYNETMRMTQEMWCNYEHDDGGTMKQCAWSRRYDATMSMMTEVQRNNAHDPGDVMQLWAWSRSYDVTTLIIQKHTVFVVPYKIFEYRFITATKLIYLRSLREPSAGHIRSV